MGSDLGASLAAHAEARSATRRGVSDNAPGELVRVEFDCSGSAWRAFGRLLRSSDGVLAWGVGWSRFHNCEMGFWADYHIFSKKWVGGADFGVWDAILCGVMPKDGS